MQMRPCGSVIINKALFVPTLVLIRRIAITHVRKLFARIIRVFTMKRKTDVVKRFKALNIAKILTVIKRQPIAMALIAGLLAHWAVRVMSEIARIRDAVPPVPNTPLFPI